MIGIVNEIELRPNLLKFALTNGGNDVIQILIWDQDIITTYRSIIVTGNVRTYKFFSLYNLLKVKFIIKKYIS